jgi:hypothetical protein
MPYFQMSTKNPTGVRPWNFALQGLGQDHDPLPAVTPSGLPISARRDAAQDEQQQDLMQRRAAWRERQQDLMQRRALIDARQDAAQLDQDGLHGPRLRRRMGFYLPANYPLPARTLSGTIPRLPMLAASPHSGKAAYGNPRPVYNALNPAYYQGLGVAAPSWFTDPAREIISGIPNWRIVAVGFAAFLFLKRR